MLRLEIAEFQNPQHFYLRLKDANGRLLGDHEVALKASDAEYEAFLDLPHYLKVHADPKRRREDEARLVGRLGEWIGKHVYGPLGEKILAAGTPCIVRVAVPEAAAGLLYSPWELGYVRGIPLARHEVTLVFEMPEKPDPVNRVAVGERLRILAVFSLPVDQSALNLRQERYELAKTVRAIGREHGRAIDLKVLQYGVTREVLRRALEEGEGWDVVHFSGHGLEAHLVLEKADGSADKVPSNEIAGLLKAARGRLKWVTLSACLSAAATVEETLRWLGVEPARGDSEAAANEKALPTVARALVKSLDCAVLAMRYPVGDQFAIDLGRGLFVGVLEQGQALARALQVTLPRAADGPDARPSSVATPTLFGGYAAEVKLEAPAGESPVRHGFDYFPAEPERFVGRVGLLTQAREVMARESKHKAVLFHGMSGGGKTACALELAYQYEDAERFTRFVWWEAPKGDSDIAGALAGFARQWEIQLDDEKAPPLVAMVNLDDAKFAASLPRLTSYLQQRSVLIVLDNLESLLRENGRWRDERWEKLFAALLGHRGQSRLVLTSRMRVQPADARVLELAVHSLSLKEAALLARQSVNLGRLLREEEHRGLVVECLKLVQGHPELLNLAERQAESAEKLAAHLERARSAETAGEAELEAFFRTGVSGLSDEGFLATLYGWTRSVSGTLSEEGRVLFHRLCCMEEEDRDAAVVKEVWGEGAAGELMASGLVDAAWRIHPGVAEAGRAEAGQAVRDEVDGKMARFWGAVYGAAEEKETEGMGGVVLRAARSAVPYLMRQREWDRARTMLEQVIQRDNSPSSVGAALPSLGRIVELTEDTEVGLRAAGVLARVLWAAGRGEEASARMRSVERKAADAGQYRLASGVAGDLVNLLRDEGHYGEALTVVERIREHTRRAGLGRWSQLAAEVWGLQILSLQGRNEEVLTAVQRLRDQIRDWPDSGEQEETVTPWNVREVLLDTGRNAALRLKRWEDALALSAEQGKTKEGRGATGLQLARTRYNNYGPLLRLRRYADAGRLLNECLAVFESEGGEAELGLVYSALADLDDELGHHTEAARHERIALRYRYTAFTPANCAISHRNLAVYLKRSESDMRSSLAHKLASGLISYQISDGELAINLRELGSQLNQTSTVDVPSTFDEVSELVERVEGVRFRELFARLPKRAASGDEALRAVLELARAPKPEMPEWLRELLAAAAAGQDVEPRIAEIEAQAAGKPGAEEVIARLRALVAQAKASGTGA